MGRRKKFKTQSMIVARHLYQVYLGIVAMDCRPPRPPPGCDLPTGYPAPAPFDTIGQSKHSFSLCNLLRRNC